MNCPICSIPVADARGLASHFRHQSVTHPDYKQWREDRRFEALVEGHDYVRCLECNVRAETLARHLKAVHGITAEEYRLKHPGAPIRAETVTQNRQEAIKAGRGSGAYKGTKTVLCPSCGADHEVHKLSMPTRCFSCKSSDEDVRWQGLVEPDDFLTCLECGYRAENLTSHAQNAHPGYRERHPQAPMVALKSAVRDKTALQGLHRTPEFKRKVREAKLLGLTPGSFQPFLEPDGTVDHRAMMRVVGCAWPTLQGYMDALGLKATTKYIEQRREARRVTLTAGDLGKHKLGNGKVSIARAVSQTERCNITIKKECRLGLVWAHGNVSQRKCLDAVSEALGGIPFQEEWKSWRFVNTPTGHRFRFDGYFQDIGLVVEFQGMFHYTFPNPWMVDESYRPEWEKLVERDRIKKTMIEVAPDLTFLEVLEDEPYMDVGYLQGRLVELGVLDVKAGGIWLGDKLVKAGSDQVDPLV